MAVQDYELLLRVRADMLQAISGLDSVRKKLDDVGKEATQTGATAGKAVDGMASKFGGLKTLISGLAIGAGIKAVLAAVIESEDAVAQLDARLKSTGSAAGLTREQLIDLSQSMQKLTTFGDEAILSMETLLLTFTSIRGPQFRDATQVVLDMSVALGQDLQSSATQVGKALNNPILGITALSKVGVNFTDQQKAVIKSLVDTGQVAEAQKVILKELQTEYGGAAEAAANTFGGALKQLKEAAGDLMEGDGGNLTDTTAGIKGLTETLRDPAIKEGFAAIVDGMIGVASYALKAIARLREFSNVVLNLGKKGADSSTDALYSERGTIQSAIDTQIANFGDKPNDRQLQAWRARLKQLDGFIAQAKDKEFTAHQFDNVESSVSSTADPKVKPVGGTTGTTGKAKAAVDNTAKFIAAGKALQDQLLALQGSLDPTAAAWNSYNAAVEKANAQAELAKQAPGANATFIDAQRDAIIGLAATMRDAAIDKISKAARDEWEALRKSLRTPIEASVEDAQAKIDQLNKLMEKGVLSSTQYHDALKRIGTGSVADAPQYQGIDPTVGGATGELNKNIAAGTELEDWHAKQLAANEAFRTSDLANEEVYKARLLEIENKYAAARANIDKSRQTLQLNVMSDFFGQIAQLSHSHNKKLATIGKAAAIAQAMIETYKSATSAYAAMASIPYIGPALGIAAAAAAIAAGLANVAAIRAQPIGFDRGGYTGPGGVHEPAGVVHRGEVVWSQRDIARAGGVGVVEAMRLGYAGYADGGFTGPMASTDGFDAPRRDPPMDTNAGSAAGGNGGGMGVRIVNVVDPGMMADWAQSSEGERVIMNTVGKNGSTLKMLVSR